MSGERTDHRRRRHSDAHRGPLHARFFEQGVERAEKVEADLVEIREGDALRTLVDVSDGVSLVYLDGAKTLYRDVLRLLEPRLSDAAVIVADNVDMQDLAFAYTSYVRAVDNGYLSSRIVIEEGLEVSLWLNASVSARTAVAL